MRKGLLILCLLAGCLDDCEAPGGSCCKVCKDSKPCGDSCIATNQTCNVGPGCACSGFTLEDF